MMSVKGFSLIEVTVAVILMTILALFTVPLYEKTIDDAARHDAKTNLNILRTAEIIYKVETNEYYAFAGIDDTVRNRIHVNVYDNGDWQFRVGGTADTATTTAVRKKGKHTGENIQMDIGTGNIVSEYIW